MKILLRRFPGESITLIDASPASKPTPIASVAFVGEPKQGSEATAGQVPAAHPYEVTLGGSTSVSPVDWRRFAYGDDDVHRLLELCIRDNLAQFAFMPHTRATFGAVSECLGVALVDLQTIADVRSLDCRAEDSHMWVEVRYETKIGVLHTLVVEQTAV